MSNSFKVFVRVGALLCTLFLLYILAKAWVGLSVVPIVQMVPITDPSTVFTNLTPQQVQSISGSWWEPKPFVPGGPVSRSDILKVRLSASLTTFKILRTARIVVKDQNTVGIQLVPPKGYRFHELEFSRTPQGWQLVDDWLVDSTNGLRQQHVPPPIL